VVGATSSYSPHMPICSKNCPLGTQHCHNCNDCIKGYVPRPFRFKGREYYFCSQKCRIELSL
jgi:hypothetical protein